MKIEAERIDPRFYLGDSVRIYIGNHRIDLTEDKARELYEVIGVALRQYPTTASTGQPDKPSAS
jgi:hypothetical protein